MIQKLNTNWIKLGTRTAGLNAIFYDVWLESFCKTVGEMDPEWGAELENAWREKMRRGIAVITAVY